MRWFRLCSTCGVLVTGLASAAAVPAQSLDFDRPESWALEYFTSASLFTELGPPPSKWIHLGVEADWLPYLSSEQRTIGFGGLKAEAINRTPIIGRPRLQVGLPLGFSVQAGWIPPISLDGARANIFSVSATKAFRWSAFTLGVSVLGQLGGISGDFTCPQSAVGSSSNTFGCTRRSHDSARLDYAGLGATAAYRIDRAFGLTPYVSAYLTYMDLGFDVNANLDGFEDTTALRTQGVTFAAAGGLAMPIADRIDLGCEAFYSPLFVKRTSTSPETNDGFFNVRALISVRLW